RRRFDRVINVWGADHHGHVARMKAVVAAFGVDPERLTVILNQLVSFKAGEDSVRFSKRKGDIITLRDLVDEVGPDACRFTFLSRSPESQMEFDLDLAKRQSSENPVYYVQYAHARLCSILRTAAERGVTFEDGDVGLLDHPRESELIRQLVELPEVVHAAAEMLEPHRLSHYALELARTLQRYYEECRVVSSVPGEEALSKARLKLVDAARVVFERTLTLMGMSAPERM
ncbi:MAG: arginine--tRNA ligase, partial [Gemmatimonadetes bacterium]|nr:arginine--tRNA ligase [Gemmatimonadota bacterium]